MKKKTIFSKMKKVVATVLAASIAAVGITATTPLAVTRAFDDVTDSGKYYFKPVYWAVEKGITSGTSDTEFSPDAICTRGQIATFLYQAIGNGEDAEPAGFSDISADKYYYRPVNWAAEKGITSGTGENKFSPNDSCTRGQIVTFLYKAAGSPESSLGSTFADVLTGKYYYRAVSWAVQNGITSGVGDNCFSPDSPCTRGQVVTFLYKYINHNQDVDVEIPKITRFRSDRYDVSVKAGEQTTLNIRVLPGVKNFVSSYYRNMVETTWGSWNAEGTIIPLIITGKAPGSTKIVIKDKDNPEDNIEIQVTVLSGDPQSDLNTDYIMGAYGIHAIKNAAYNPDSVHLKEAFIDVRDYTFGNGSTGDRMFVCATAMNKMGGYSPVYCTVIKVKSNENYPNAEYYDGYYYATFVFNDEPYDPASYNVSPRINRNNILDTYDTLFGTERY